MPVSAENILLKSEYSAPKLVKTNEKQESAGFQFFRQQYNQEFFFPF